MLKKTVTINNEDKKWTGTVIEYRLFGVLIFKKTLNPPSIELHTEFLYDF